jgi:murein DD-endopeptidase MepM/ murein hydrolase activator NlpD/peptidoglycan hydrolase-like protein with peptidoglycan-binding domain
MHKKIVFRSFLGFTILLLPIIVLSPVFAQLFASHRTQGNFDERYDEEGSGQNEPADNLRSKIAALGPTRVEQLTIPILLGLEIADLEDTWGDARSNGRVHEGIDIFAPRGAFVVSPTNAVVTRIGVGQNGGNYVYTTNPSGERFYFAHLDAYKESLAVGDVLAPGDLIGYVGNTGNAMQSPPHLHFGIYNRGVQNPFPRFTKTFSTHERIASVGKVLQASKDPITLARKVVAENRTFFLAAEAAGVILPPAIFQVFAEERRISDGADLTIGVRGSMVSRLQQFLISQHTGSAAEALTRAGATGYFGPATERALAEYQRAVGISPASGYYGLISRMRIEPLLPPLHPPSPTPGPTSFIRDLKRGASGADVRALQVLLNAKGFPVAASGPGSPGNETTYFGLATERALTAFQKAHSISPASSYFGSLTRVKIESI